MVATKGPRSTEPTPERIVVRPYPKIVVFYPVMLASFLCAFLCHRWQDQPGADEHIATLFVTLLSINAIVLAFEFPRMTALFVAVLLTLIGVVIAWLQLYIYILTALDQVHWTANAHFYLAIGTTLLGVYGIVWLVTRFDYWEFTPNEFIHHHGPFADMQRYPTISLRVDKEIPDICEYLLMRAGRLVLHPVGEDRVIILEIVLNVTRVERQIKDMMRAMDVRLEPRA